MAAALHNRDVNTTNRPHVDVPLVSIITPALNAADRIPGAIASILAQDHPAIERIVVDGGSNDGTAALIAAEPRGLAWWCSEPDRGISHAFNKGIARARGEIVGILNADDRYTAGAISRAVATLHRHPEAGFCFGHCLHVTPGAPDWLNLGNPHYRRRILARMPDVNHPTMFVRRAVYARLGGYQERWRYAMDYEFLLRMDRAGIRGVLVPAVQTIMAMGGASDRRWLVATREVERISLLYGQDPALARQLHAWRVVKGRVRRAFARWGAWQAVMTVRRAGRQRMLSLRASG